MVSLTGCTWLSQSVPVNFKQIGKKVYLLQILNNYLFIEKNEGVLRAESLKCQRTVEYSAHSSCSANVCLIATGHLISERSERLCFSLQETTIRVGVGASKSSLRTSYLSDNELRF